MSNISTNGVKFIKQFEGFVNHAYKPVSDEIYYTIGYGHYGPDVRVGQTITEPQAEQLLANDLQRYVSGVASLVHVSLNQNQFDALVSFAYNVGVGALGKSTLLTKLNAGDYKGAALEFPKWVYGAGGLALQGLVNRRHAEQNLFNTPVVQPAPVPQPAPVQPTPAPTLPSDLPLQVGSKGPDVEFVQRFLGITADGDFGEHTKEAVAQYQEMRGLSADGIVGPVTWRNMHQ